AGGGAGGAEARHHRGGHRADAGAGAVLRGAGPGRRGPGGGGGPAGGAGAPLAGTRGADGGAEGAGAGGAGEGRRGRSGTGGGGDGGARGGGGRGGGRGRRGGGRGGLAVEPTGSEGLDEWIKQLGGRVSAIPFRAIGVIGLVALLYAAISMLVEVERAFNQIY